MQKMFLSLLAITLASGNDLKDDGQKIYQVYRVVPSSDLQVKMLQSLNQSTDFSLWKNTKGVNDSALIMVPTRAVSLFLSIMDATGLEYNLSLQDVESFFNSLEGIVVSNTNGNTSQTTYSLEKYHTLQEINAWLDKLESKNPTVKVVTAGKSYEGREVRGIEITNGANLPGVILESGIHAREWIAPAATSWIVNEILNSDDDSIYKQYNYLYFPVANPDGYEYTWTTDRAWRKTRQPYVVDNAICYGADPNRNWDFQWKASGAAPNHSHPCSEYYPGPKPFSEPETKALADYFRTVSHRYDIYLAFHSFYQLVMYPWGYSSADTPMTKTWKRIGNKIAAAMKTVHGTTFTVGNIHDVIYPSYGNSVDWYYENFNSTLTFAFELRSKTHGFDLPADQIIPSGEELMAAFRVILTEYSQLS